MKSKRAAMKYLIKIFYVIMLTGSIQAQKKQARIIAGKDIRVSNDGNFTHGEYMLAANPLNPNNLIGVASIFPFDGDDRVSIPYISIDGGKSWTEITFPDQVKGSASGDPQIAFSNRGIAYFGTYTTVMNKEGRGVPNMYFYTSTDQGRTWRRSLSENLFDKLEGYDHQQLVVDQTNGKFEGRIYFSILTTELVKSSNDNYYQYYLMLFYSDDSGKSFQGPVKAVVGEKDDHINTSKLLVSSNGTLFFPYFEWKNLGDDYNLYMVSSKNGGVTFSEPKKMSGRNIDDSMFYTPSFPLYAIDNQSKKYRDRLYCVFSNRRKRNEKSRLLFTFSEDEGKNWSKPKLVDPACPEDVFSQYQPDITVNSKGVIGIRWYDTRNNKKVTTADNAWQQDFDEYFTASLDGGETFLPPVRVSSKTSKVIDFSNEVVVPIWRRSSNKDTIAITFKNSEGSRFSNGGDYMQFTADANGIFHDFWADARDGRAYQIYTNAMEVITPGGKEKIEATKIRNEIRKPTSKTDFGTKRKNVRNVSRYVYLHMDPASYDSSTNLLCVPIRIRNISNKPIYGPIKLMINGIDTSWGKRQIPTLLNSDNKEGLIGAEFNYTINNSKVLYPGDETETVTYKFRVKIRDSITIFGDDIVKEFKLNKKYSISWYPEDISELRATVTGILAE